MAASLVLEFILFVGLGLLSWIWPERRGQPLIRRDLVIDGLYLFAGLITVAPLTQWIYGLVRPPAVVAMVARWPLALQTLIVLFAFDALQYVLHRWLHEDRLWRIHAVHHSAEAMDMMTGFRNHPLNLLITVATPTALLLFLGFSPQAFAVLAPFNFVMASLVHANLDWSFGPFRYLLVSPMYHRWHHAVIDGSKGRNFAPLFPVWDLLFGSYHMPEGEAPEVYGAAEVPQGFIAQLAYPLEPAWPTARAAV
jgi:sterol desaturase/sphingolipid hydroxylase (fatty acid hydroxylase superfamily)